MSITDKLSWLRSLKNSSSLVQWHLAYRFIRLLFFGTRPISGRKYSTSTYRQDKDWAQMPIAHKESDVFLLPKGIWRLWYPGTQRNLKKNPQTPPPERIRFDGDLCLPHWGRNGGAALVSCNYCGLTHGPVFFLFFHKIHNTLLQRKSLPLTVSAWIIRNVILLMCVYRVDNLPVNQIFIERLLWAEDVAKTLKRS